MEVQIKKAIKAGNSSAVILPRSWLNKEIRVELIKKTHEMMLLDVIGMLKNYINTKEIIGVYLTGSYARREEDNNSDIDILVITKNVDKEMIIEGIYNVLIVSKYLLEQKLQSDLFPIGQMIKEAVPLLNFDYLNSIKISVTNKNVKWYIDTTEDKLSIIKKILERAKRNNKKYLEDRIVYTLILRIRTLHIIEKLITNKDYSKKDFIKLIKKVSKGSNAYERYLAIKNNLEEKKVVSLEEAERLYNYLEEQLIRIKRLSKKALKT